MPFDRAETSTSESPSVQGSMPPSPGTHSVALGYLRAFVTVLVVVHHAVLAYHPFAPRATASLATEPRWWQAFPVVDSQRWTGFALVVGFNDVFFMALMFFLSGLFVWRSLERKGSAAFVRDRALRLGIPFVVCAALVAPLAYYPSYLQRSADPSPSAFWREWLSLGNWPAGPAWFLWVLLAFGAIAAGLFALAPRWCRSAGRLAAAFPRPAAFLGALVGVSALVYIPLALVFSPLHWAVAGPFTFQTSRILLYALYFFAGIALGAQGIDRGLLAPDGRLARRWALWLGAALGAFALVTVAVIVAMSPGRSPSIWGTIGGVGFVLSCAASSFALLALFLRFAKARVKMLDSLGDNAYGIYLVHYPFVSWLQYLLLTAPLSGIVKGTVVFLGALVLSWTVTAALRRIPAVARVI
jgi:peptidoglycan/LPS O-acetylase OafA/YrhL